MLGKDSSLYNSCQQPINKNKHAICISRIIDAVFIGWVESEAVKTKKDWDKHLF